jgi:hypothetical protein
LLYEIISRNKDGVFKVNHKSERTITSPNPKASFFYIFFLMRNSLAGSLLIVIITAPTLHFSFKTAETGKIILAKEETFINSFKASLIKGVFLIV